MFDYTYINYLLSFSFQYNLFLYDSSKIHHSILFITAYGRNQKICIVFVECIRISSSRRRKVLSNNNNYG